MNAGSHHKTPAVLRITIALGILGAYAGSVYGWLAADERFVSWIVS